MTGTYLIALGIMAICVAIGGVLILILRRLQIKRRNQPRESDEFHLTPIDNESVDYVE